MDQKLDKAQAKKLEEERMFLQAKRLLLSTEETLDEVTLNKIRDKWYNIFLNIRVPEMQDNLRHILHYMEKLIETHGFRKLLFEEERHALDNLYTLQAQSQSSALQTLNDIYVRRIEDMQKTYRQHVAEKQRKAEEEFAQLEDNECETRENMQTMLFQMEQNRNLKEDQMNCDMFFKIDDERSKNTEKLENLRWTLEKKMEKRWEEINTTISTYDANTQQRRQHYVALKAKDDSDSKIIYQQMKKTQKLIEQVEELKNSYEYAYAPQETLNLITDLREERSKFFDSFKFLKSCLAEEVSEDKDQLKFLAVLTDSITEDLKEVCEKGEKILTLFRICRKFETEEEKVVPVGGNLHLLKPTDAVEKRKHVADDRGPTDGTPDSLTKPYSSTPDKFKICVFGMGEGHVGTLAALFDPNKKAFFTRDIDFEVLNKFWKKSSKVRLTTMAISKVIEDMEKENALLKRSLISYLKEASGKSRKAHTS